MLVPSLTFKPAYPLLQPVELPVDVRCIPLQVIAEPGDQLTDVLLGESGCGQEICGLIPGPGPFPYSGYRSTREDVFFRIVVSFPAGNTGFVPSVCGFDANTSFIICPGTGKFFIKIYDHYHMLSGGPGPPQFVSVVDLAFLFGTTPGCPRIVIDHSLINDFCPESLHVLAPGRTCSWCGQKMYKVMTAVDIRGARKKEIFYGF